MLTGLFSPTHLLLLGLIALLVFGPKRLPEIGRSLGHGLRGFKESVSGEHPDGVAEPQAAAPDPLGLPQASIRRPDQPVEVVLDAGGQEQKVG